MITGNRKVDPKITETLEQTSINFKVAIKEAEEIITLKNHGGWIRLIGNVSSQLEGIERQLDNFETLGDREIVVTLKQRKDLRLFINMVPRIEERLPELYQAYADTERKLMERKENSGIGNT